MELTVLTWNLYHGRDFPPDERLRTWRSRVFRITERNETHAQVNRELRSEFTNLIRDLPWDIALLQECPPRWIGHLASACDADAHHALTARNSCGRLRALAARANPDLIASSEGGSNLILCRTTAIAAGREFVLRQGPKQERRTMAFAELDNGVCVANLHSALGIERSHADTIRGADQAASWAGDRTLIFGGDLNNKPGQSNLYEELEVKHDLRGHTEEGLDHILARGLAQAEPARRLRAEEREVKRDDGLLIRLSDHPPVLCTLATG